MLGNNKERIKYEEGTPSDFGKMSSELLEAKRKAAQKTVKYRMQKELIKDFHTKSMEKYQDVLKKKIIEKNDILSLEDNFKKDNMYKEYTKFVNEYSKRETKNMGGLLQDDEKRMGYSEGGGDLLNKRLEATINEETKYAKEYGDDYFKKGTGLFGRLGRSLGDSGEGLRAFTEMRKANNQLGDKYTNEQLTTMLNQGYSDKGLEYKFTLPEKFKSERKQKAEGGSLLADDMETPMMPEEMPEMESDSDMEENYTRFIMDEALSEEEEDMLVSKLEQDEELQMLFDKVIDVAQEFAGNGPVEGPGTGVSDDIPARLSDGEFVFTAKAVEEIGEDTLMSMMKDAEVAADERQGFAGGEMVEDNNMNVKADALLGMDMSSNPTQEAINENMIKYQPYVRS